MQRYEHEGRLLALLFTGDWYEGTNFVSKDEDDLQVGTWVYPKGTELKAHYHEHNPRVISKTREFVYVQQGRVLARLYTEEGETLWEFTINAGQFAVFIDGAHGYYFAEDSKVIEVKAGEFNYDDKVRL